MTPALGKGGGGGGGGLTGDKNHNPRNSKASNKIQKNPWTQLN